MRQKDLNATSVSSKETRCVAMVVCILFVTCRYDKSNKIRLPINITVVLPFQVSLSVITND